MVDKFEIQGADELMRKLREIAPRLQKRELRAAARKSMNIVRDAARAKARQIDDPGTAESIAKNIVTQENARRSRAVGGVVMRVGVRGGAKQYANTRDNARKGRAGKSYATGGSKKNPGGDTWYWRLVEFGRNGARAQPFMRPAMNENTEAVTQRFTTELSAGIDRVVAQL